MTTTWEDEKPSTNDEGRYYKLYVTLIIRPKKGKPIIGQSNLIWFTAKRAAEFAYAQLTEAEFHVVKLYRV